MSFMSAETNSSKFNAKARDLFLPVYRAACFQQSFRPRQISRCGEDIFTKHEKNGTGSFNLQSPCLYLLLKPKRQAVGHF